MRGGFLLSTDEQERPRA